MSSKSNSTSPAWVGASTGGAVIRHFSGVSSEDGHQAGGRQESLLQERDAVVAAAEEGDLAVRELLDEDAQQAADQPRGAVELAGGVAPAPAERERRGEEGVGEKGVGEE